jgi:hypothetical protein
MKPTIFKNVERSQQKEKKLCPTFFKNVGTFLKNVEETSRKMLEEACRKMLTKKMLEHL